MNAAGAPEIGTPTMTTGPAVPAQSPDLARIRLKLLRRLESTKLELASYQNRLEQLEQEAKAASARAVAMQQRVAETESALAAIHAALEA